MEGMIQDPEQYRLVADSMHGVATVAVVCTVCAEDENNDGVVHTFDFLYPSLTDVQKVADGHEAEKHAIDPDILRLAAELVTEGARHGSPSMLTRRLGQDFSVTLTHEGAKAVLRRLEAAGIVGPMDPWKHAHPVLLDRQDALNALGGTDR